MNSTNFFLTDQDKEEIVNSIKNAESCTSGEIRVHILKKNRVNDIMLEAAKWFKKLGMIKTKDRNGILLIIAPNAKKFAIIGDKGINEKIDANFWNSIKDQIQISFKNNEFTQGIKEAVISTGQILKKFFPIMPDDINELPDEITES